MPSTPAPTSSPSGAPVPSAVYAVGAGRYDCQVRTAAPFPPMTSGVTTTLRAVTAPRDNTSLVLAGGDNGLLLVWNGAVWVASPPLYRASKSTPSAQTSSQSSNCTSPAAAATTCSGTAVNGTPGYNNSKATSPGFRLCPAPTSISCRVQTDCWFAITQAASLPNIQIRTRKQRKLW